MVGDREEGTGGGGGRGESLRMGGVWVDLGRESQLGCGSQEGPRGKRIFGKGRTCVGAWPTGAKLEKGSWLS